MTGEKQCEAAIQITGSRMPIDTIKTQCELMSSTERFLLANAIEKVLRQYEVTPEECWDVCRDEIEEAANDYIVDPAAALCLYMDWKQER